MLIVVENERRAETVPGATSPPREEGRFVIILTPCVIKVMKCETTRAGSLAGTWPLLFPAAWGFRPGSRRRRHVRGLRRVGRPGPPRHPRRVRRHGRRFHGRPGGLGVVDGLRGEGVDTDGDVEGAVAA